MGNGPCFLTRACLVIAAILSVFWTESSGRPQIQKLSNSGHICTCLIREDISFAIPLDIMKTKNSEYIYYKAERKIYCKTDRQTFDKLQWLKNDDSKGKQTEKAKLNKFPNKYCQDNAHPAPIIWKMWTAWWITFCKWSHFYGPHWQSRPACCERPGKVCQNLRYHISMIESMVFRSVRV